MTKPDIFSEWMRDDSEELVNVHKDLNAPPPWKVLIVDDEPDVHAMTRLALREMSYRGRSLELLSAYSGKEGFEQMSAHPDTAIVLLDVVMEEDDAGLRLAARIREELGNSLVRIVLRTGQPGQAPEEKVIVDYDINDYKAKSELTARRLFVAVISSLRTYEGLLVIDSSRRGLHRILKGTENLYQHSSLQEFASGVLYQVSGILGVGAEGVLCAKLIDPPSETGMDFHLIAGTGKYADLITHGGWSDKHPFFQLVKKGFELKKNHYEHPYDVLYFSTQNCYRFVIVFSPPWPLEAYQRDLLGVFCDRMASAFDNLYLYQQLHASSEATVIALADLAEFRDKSTGKHLMRVQRLTNAVVDKLHAEGKFPDEITETFRSMIGTASILHDVGKVATPDHVLLKPGKHTEEERAIMKEHAQKGQVILERAADKIIGESYLSYGAQIAGGHHECYDGSGYPKGLKGNENPLAARIVAVVDVFDALAHHRIYKEPWSAMDTLEYMKNASGTQFDPDILNAFLSVVEKNPNDWIDASDL
jgi:response regulator RpfG family c-di-GMP phosphodiesterase